MDQKIDLSAYEDTLNYVSTAQESLIDQDMLGGSILRPLNTSNHHKIDTPFLQAIMEYGDGQNIRYFKLNVTGDGYYTKSDKLYEVWLLTGPETTDNELNSLKSINDTKADFKMTEKLMDTMWKSAFRMYVSDGDHEIFLGIVEQAYIKDSGRVFGRVFDTYHETMTVGYWNVY